VEENRMLGYATALALAIEAAREAGGMLREEFHRSGGPRGSGGHAEIDELAERCIKERLLAASPWSYLGEETGAVAGSDEHHIWLVDPNDGTSAYLRGWRGSAVSIAALRDGMPILGVVYAFAYPDSGEGDLIAWAEGCPLTRNGQPVITNLADTVLDSDTNPPPIVFVSQDADKNPAANAACVRPAHYIALPSIAYRLACVAAGDGIAAVSLNGPGSWDYAAGHALLRGSGGVLLNEQGHEVVYDRHGHSSTHWCFGGSPAAVRELCRRPWREVFSAALPARHHPSAWSAPSRAGRWPTPGCCHEPRAVCLGNWPAIRWVG
jgi:fructose-1,6-bisphosphatase/inositol monophosphatase family enzyme